MIGQRRRGPHGLSRLLLLVVMVLVFSAGTAAAEQHNDNYYNSILPQFMCTTCHEPLELVSSQQALSEKAYLQSLVTKGLTLSQIKANMVDQFGEGVLAQPPAKGFNLIVYILPPVVVIAGLLLLAYTLPKWRRRSREAAATTLPSSDPLKPDEANRLDSELDQFI